MKRLPIVLAALLFAVITSVWAAPPFPQKSVERDDHKSQGNDHKSQDNVAAAVATLQAQVAALQAQVAALQVNSALTLNRVVNVGYDANGYKTVLFSGVNVQIVNGLGSTDTINGLGNLIIGYNAARPLLQLPSGAHCSIGGFEHVTGIESGVSHDEAGCRAAGGTFAINHKNGSHYLVVGDQNNYSQYGGAVIGFHNTANHYWASVTGGEYNFASAEYASVSGGMMSVANGTASSVTGGTYNWAKGAWSSVTAGHGNWASGDFASVHGGSIGYATGNGASLIGGYRNTASGGGAIITGGRLNTASGGGASVSGGVGCEETREYGVSVGQSNIHAAGCVPGLSN